MSPNERAARQLAEAFRSEHGLGDAPVADPFELVHTALGIDVISLEAGDSEHGLSMRDPDTGRVVIAVATTPHPMRQRSSVAHELGHVLAGDLEGNANLGDDSSAAAGPHRSPQEIRADAFARHLLLPADAVTARAPRRAGSGSVEESALSDLCQTFEVSPSLASIQLRDCGLIDSATFERWSRLSAPTLAARHGWLGQYKALAAASQQPRAPQSLMRRAVEGYHQGVLGLAELASWYGSDTSELSDELGPPAALGEDDLDLDADQDEPLFPPGFLTEPEGSA